MTPLERNLQSLAARDPESARRVAACAPTGKVRCVRARTGASTIEVDGRLDAGLEDPEADGTSLAQHFLTRAQAAGATRLVLFGLGVHTLRFVADFSGDILVVEPRLDVARRVLEIVDLTDFLSQHSLILTGDAEVVFAHPLFTAESNGLFLSHAPTRRRHPKLHDLLAARFHPGGDAAPLDVAVIPPLYGGSLPIARATARALRQLGHHVRDLDLSPFLPAYQELLRCGSDLRLSRKAEELRAALVRLIGETLLTQFWIEPPDVVFAIAQAPLDPASLAQLGERGIVRAFWFCEDAHVMPYWSELSKSYDVFFHLQPDTLSEPLRERGVFGLPLPVGFDPEVHHPVELSEDQRARYACELSCIGAGYHNRIEFLPGLFDMGLRLYGTDWPAAEPFLSSSPEFNQRQTSESCNLIFNASSVNLNLHSSPWTDGVNPLGDYVNPRCFEVAGAGAFQLVDERRLLGTAFEIGSEIDTFRDLSECRHKIRYYWNHADERREMAGRARERALRDHTYVQRMRVAIDALRSGPSPALPKKRCTPTAGHAVQSLREQEPTVARILERLPSEMKLDQEALYLAVASGEGDLCEEERLLLFMREAMTEIQILNAAGDPA